MKQRRVYTGINPAILNIKKGERLQKMFGSDEERTYDLDGDFIYSKPSTKNNTKDIIKTKPSTKAKTKAEDSISPEISMNVKNVMKNLEIK